MVKLIYKNYDLHDIQPSTRDYLIFTQQLAIMVQESEDYKQLSLDVGMLQAVPINHLSEPQKFIFWTNVYNLICLHGAIELRAKYIWSNFFNEAAYSIDHEIYTLNDIGNARGTRTLLTSTEHGILRGNAIPIHSSSKIPQLPDYDLRLMHTIIKATPMVHFLKTCNTKSSPHLYVLDEENYESQMKEAAETFCSNFVNVYGEKVRNMSIYC
jgi:hypothetical protein